MITRNQNLQTTQTIKIYRPKYYNWVNKKCNVCQSIKILNDFTKNGLDKSGKTVYKPICKECINRGNKLKNTKIIPPRPLPIRWY